VLDRRPGLLLACARASPTTGSQAWTQNSAHSKTPSTASANKSWGILDGLSEQDLPATLATSTRPR